MNDRAAAQSLVVVALSATAREDYAIELACELAPSEAPELLGLFVENAELLEQAGSRRAREILLTGQERELNLGSLERQLRSQAARARASFETATARRGMRHRFEVARGDVLAEPIRRAAAAQALVVSLTQALGGIWPRGFARQLIEARLPLVFLAREGWLTGHSVAVVVDDIDASNPVLDAAARVARQSRSPIAILLTGAAEAGAGDLARRAQDALTPHGIDSSDVILLGGTGVAGILHAARACRARLLVMASPAEPAESDTIDELMRRFAGALMLVRA